MLKFMQRNFSMLFAFLFSITLSVALAGCMPQANKENLSGLSVGTLDKPNVPANTVLVMANQAAISAYTYDYSNYQSNLQAASQYFTPEGWQTFMTALTASGNLNKVVDNKLAVSAVALGSPIILSQGELAGRYSWRVQMPLQVTYQGDNNLRKQYLLVNMLIVRTSPAESNRGLGIKQFIATERPQLKAMAATQTFQAPASTINNNSNPNIDNNGRPMLPTNA